MILEIALFLLRPDVALVILAIGAIGLTVAMHMDGD
jgi:hypothetical protein